MKFDQTLPKSCSTALEVLQYMHTGSAQDFISGLSWRTRPTPHCPEMRENRERVAAQLIFNLNNHKTQQQNVQIMPQNAP